MAYSIFLPFQTFQISLPSGDTMSFPLSDTTAIRLNEKVGVLARKYTNVLQQYVFDKGAYVRLLDEYRKGNFEKKQVQVPFKASKDKITHPAFELTFDYYFQTLENGFIAFIPTLGIEVCTINIDQLKHEIIEAIRLEFARNERLYSIHKLVQAIWFEEVELIESEISIKTHSLSELEVLDEEKKEFLLPKVASIIQEKQPQIYGHKKTLIKVGSALQSKFNKNVLLVGASGVGKTALIHEIARTKNRFSIKYDFWETTASTLIKELTKETGWQDNMVYLCKELAKRGDFLVISNLMELFEVGKYEGNSVSIAEYMSSYISRGEVHILSECTPEELAKIELLHPSFLSSFQVINIEEPKKDLTSIVLRKINDISKERSIAIDQSAVEETIRLNKRFTPYAGFPGKPIRFLENILSNFSTQLNHTHPTITKSDIIHQFCEETGIPPFMIDPSISMDTQKVTDFFESNVFGQQSGVNSVVDMLSAVKTALTRTGKPISSFLFVGPTGVGKTEMAKVLAQFMFGSRDRMIRFDMSEYSTPYAVMSLTGTGYHKNGKLTSAIRREPFCVLLFDEIEKADASFYDVLLQLLSEGRLTDSKGKLVNFCSTIIIMTSNIGASRSQQQSLQVGKKTSTTEMAAYYQTAVEQHFRPELFNRIDKIVPFLSLSNNVIRKVVEREIELFCQREGIRYRNISLQVENSVHDYFAKKSKNSKYGARFLQRQLREELFIPLSKRLNIEDFDDQLDIVISLKNETIQMEIIANPLGFDMLLETLSHNNLSEYASDLRRNIARLIEGYFYVSVCSAIEILELEKRKDKAAFWEKKEKAQRYTHLLQTQQDVLDLKTQIEAIEHKMALACLGSQAFKPEWEQEIKDWIKIFNDKKVDWYARQEPKINLCRFNIYGLHSHELINIYLDIFKRKGYQVTGNVYWFNKDHFNELVPHEQTEKWIPRSTYKTSIWTEHWKDLKPEDQLIAVEWLIMGKAAKLFLKDEIGIQEWTDEDGIKQYFKIQLADQPEDIPNTIHRKNYFKNVSIRRKVHPNTINDTIYDLKNQTYKNNIADLIFEQMETRFRLAIDRALI